MIERRQSGGQSEREEREKRRERSARVRGACRRDCVKMTREVDVRLPGKCNSNSHGASPVHLIITTIKWIWTSRFVNKELSR